MEEIMLMTSLFAAGVGTGAVLRYARDRKLLCLYGHLVEDLSRMIPHGEPDPAQAAAARNSDMPSGATAQQKRAS
jgi:hypothetical protein